MHGYCGTLGHCNPILYVAKTYQHVIEYKRKEEYQQNPDYDVQIMEWNRPEVGYWLAKVEQGSQVRAIPSGHMQCGEQSIPRVTVVVNL